MAKQRIKIKEADTERVSAEKRKQAWLAALDDLVSHAIHTGIPDLADEHDHYLYGGTKQNASQ